jgi:hypothetical protein
MVLTSIALTAAASLSFKNIPAGTWWSMASGSFKQAASKDQPPRRDILQSFAPVRFVG